MLIQSYQEMESPSLACYCVPMFNETLISHFNLSSFNLSALSAVMSFCPRLKNLQLPGASPTKDISTDTKSSLGILLDKLNRGSSQIWPWSIIGGPQAVSSFSLPPTPAQPSLQHFPNLNMQTGCSVSATKGKSSPLHCPPACPGSMAAVMSNFASVCFKVDFICPNQLIKSFIS